MSDTRSKGGRGLRAENKYERLTVTLPPETKAKLDGLASTAGLNRSEMLAKVIQDYGEVEQMDKPVIPVTSESLRSQNLMPVQSLEPVEQHTPLPGSAPDPLEGLEVLHVVSSEIPQSLRTRLKWLPERYTALEGRLQSTKALRLLKNRDGCFWFTDDDVAIRRPVVEKLFAAGVLTAGS